MATRLASLGNDNVRSGLGYLVSLADSRYLAYNHAVQVHKRYRRLHQVRYCTYIRLRIPGPGAVQLSQRGIYYGNEY